MNKSRSVSVSSVVSSEAGEKPRLLSLTESAEKTYANSSMSLRNNQGFSL
jgi:hypothetical protein